MQKKTSKKASSVRLEPLSDRVLVKPFTAEDLRQREGKQNSYGIILPESMKEEKSAQGKVVALGPGKIVDGKITPIGLKVGDIVIFSKYAYDEVELGGEEFYLLREENILAKVK